jgi:hypothetical protein
VTLDQAIAAATAYVSGVARQDAEALRQLFDTDAHIVGIDEGKFTSVPRDRWIAFVTSPDRKGAGAEEFDVVSVTIHHSAAAVSVRTRYGAFEYTDILSMLLVDGSVRIVGKTYHQHPKSAGKGGLLT